MKTTQPGDTKPVPPLSRRKFLEQGAGAALALSVVPRHVLGGPGYVPPSDKVNIAFIGVGSQGLRVMLHFLKEPDVQGVAVCDPNKASADYPQWDTHEFSKSVRSEEHTSELQSRLHLVCRLLLEKKNTHLT